jgi:hypothetical protein
MKKPTLRRQRMYCIPSPLFRASASFGMTKCRQAVNGTHFTDRALIEIFHKERGGKGVWKMIEQGHQIRVTKNVGKRVKLVTKVSVKFGRSDMQLRLLDLSDAGNPQEGQCHLETVVLKVLKCFSLLQH